MDETECADPLDGTPAPSAAAREHGAEITDPTTARIGRFVILRRLGAGGMGVVFAAYDEQLDRKLALKLLHRRARSDRLRREAQGLARLSHPNVVQIYEIGEHEGAVFMAMEFVAGQTLGDWIEAKTRSRAEILEAFAAAGRGLAAAHVARLIHRDFKPDNVMIGDDGQVKVMDFGLVRAEGEEPSSEPGPELGEDEGDELEATEDHEDADALDLSRGATVERSVSRSRLDQVLTQTGSIMGTPAYMAPEQHRGASTDPRSDQFSFCVALWEALYGQRPFRGDSVAAVAFNVLRGEVAEPPREADVPTWLRRVVERGLALEPEARWPSMDALLAALARDPTRHYPLILASVAIVALVVGAWGWARVQREREGAAARQARSEAIASCEQGGRAFVAGAWTEQRRVRAQQAFEASKLPFAADAWQRSAARLDAYASELEAAHAQTCLDTEPDPEHAEHSQRCLEDRLAALDSLAALLAEADDGRIHGALSSSAGLPLIESCSDPRSLAHQPPLPEDPEVRAEVLALRAELAELRARQTMAEFDEALAQVQPLVERAEALGWEPMVAEALLMQAELLDDTGDYGRARAGFERALYIAGKAGADTIAIDAASELVHTVGSDLDDPEEGLRIAKLAEVLIARSGAEGSLVEARLRVNIGAAVQRAGDIEAALDAFEVALAIQDAELPPNQPVMAITLNNIGVAHAQKGQLEQALGFFERSMAIRTASFPAGHPRLATAHLNLGMAYSSLERNDEARAALERALEISRLNFDPEHPDIARALHALAIVALNSGDADEAVERFSEALRLRELKLPADHVALGQTQLALGRALTEAGDSARAIEHYERAREIFAANAPLARKDLAAAWMELALAQDQLDEADAALASFALALEVASEPKIPPLDLAEVQWHFALTLGERAPKRRAEAIELMQASYVGYAEHGEPGDLEEIVEWLEARGASVPEQVAE